jgi:hypothetical protein
MPVLATPLSAARGPRSLARCRSGLISLVKEGTRYTLRAADLSDSAYNVGVLHGIQRRVRFDALSTCLSRMLYWVRCRRARGEHVFGTPRRPVVMI